MNIVDYAETVNSFATNLTNTYHNTAGLHILVELYLETCTIAELLKKHFLKNHFCMGFDRKHSHDKFS